MPYRTHKESDEGIVLLKKKTLDSDGLIIVLTKHFGKIALLAKGVQKITSKRIAALQTGNIVRLSFTQKNNSLRYLSSIELISHLSAIKKDLTKLHYLYTLLFLWERLIPDGQIDPHLYQVCKKSIIELAVKNIEVFSITSSISTLLSQMGYGECTSYDECAKMAEEIMGKKLPIGVI